MLIISVHGISLHANVGLYEQEKITGNDFEIDVDVNVAAIHSDNFPFIDYSIINELVHEAFRQPGELLEQFVKTIHRSVKEKFAEATTVRVVVRKLHPAMGGEIKYAQVAFEG